MFTHQCVYIDSITPIDVGFLIGKDEEDECDTQLHEVYRSVPGVVAWIVLTRAELAVYVQASQRGAHASRIEDCKRLNIVIRYMKRHKCGIKPLTLQHPLELVPPTDAVFKAQPEEPIGLATRGLAAVFCEDRGDKTNPHGSGGKVNLIDLTARRQRRAIRFAFSAEFHGLIGSSEQMLLSQRLLHQIYCGTARSPERMIDLLERGSMYPPFDLCADARAVHDAIYATNVCKFAGSSLKLHLISIRDRLTYGLIRKFFLGRCQGYARAWSDYRRHWPVVATQCEQRLQLSSFPRCTGASDEYSRLRHHASLERGVGQRWPPG